MLFESVPIKLSGAINSLLSKPDITLFEVIEDEEFLGELAANNESLYEYLDEKKLNTLIEMITVEPSLADDYKRCFVYPFVVAQMLTTDCKYVYDKMLAKDRDYAPLLKVFEYFFKGGTNPTLGGYVNKVISFLLSKRPLDMIAFFDKKPEALSALLSAINTFPAFDLLRRIFLLNVDESNQLYIALREKLLSQIFGMIKPENKKQLVNITELCISLLNNMYIMRGGKRITSALLDPAIFAKFEAIYSSETEAKIRQRIVKFWVTLIDNCFLKSPKELAYEEVEINFGFYFLNEPSEDSKESGKSEEKLLGNLLHKESKQAAEATKYFTNKDITPLIPVLLSVLGTIGKLLDPKMNLAKGIEKAGLIMLISKVVRLGNEELHAFIIKSQLIEKSINLARAMENNSLIHISVVDLLRGVLQQQGFPIRTHLLHECNIIPKFMEYVQADRHKFEKTKKSVGLGHTSFFLQFLVEIKSISDMDAEISEIIRKQPTWETFKTMYIQHQMDQEEAKSGNCD